MLTYAKGSYSVSSISTDVITDVLAGVITYMNERLASSVDILRAWSYVTDPKEVRNDSDSRYKP